MSRIAEKPTHGLADLKDKSTMYLPIANRYALDSNGLGVPQSATYDVLEQSLSYQFLSQNGHGLVASDLGKPLSGHTVYSDTVPTQFPTAVLAHVTDANTILVALPGAHVRLPASILDGGSSYNIASNGRLVWWDASAGLYKATRQSDAVSGSPPILYILRITGGFVDAQVRPLVSQPLRLIGEYSITSADVTAKSCSFLAAGVAVAGMLFIDGLAMSSADVTVNWIAGTASWSATALDTRVSTGMILTGFFEPRT